MVEPINSNQTPDPAAGQPLETPTTETPGNETPTTANAPVEAAPEAAVTPPMPVTPEQNPVAPVGQNPPPSQSPAEGNPPTGASGAPTGQPVPAGNSNKIIIIVVVIIVVLMALGWGTYFTLRYFARKKISQALQNTQSMITPSGGTPSASGDNYVSSEAVTPTGAVAKELDTTFSSVFNSVFGGSKLTESSSTDGSENMAYVVKKKISAADATKVGTELVAKGFAQTSSSAEAAASTYVFTKDIGGKTYNVSVSLSLESTPYEVEQQYIRISANQVV